LSAILTLLLETAVWYSIAVLQKRYGPVDFGRGIGVTSQSLNKEFAMATLRDLIKDRKVHSIMEHNIGALPVLRDGELAGIFSERDIMNRVVAVGRTPGTTAVSEVMTPNPRAVPVDETVEECLFIMREFGFRHLPIVDGRELKGLVSLRDILMRRAAEIESEARRAVS
jgi:signal-transduction protein with cAMP-binding, CBS, and nucleotidyltransferase domain